MIIDHPWKPFHHYWSSVSPFSYENIIYQLPLHIYIGDTKGYIKKADPELGGQSAYSQQRDRDRKTEQNASLGNSNTKLKLTLFNTSLSTIFTLGASRPPFYIHVLYLKTRAPDYTNDIIKVKLIIHVHIHYLQQINSLNFLHCVLFTPLQKKIFERNDTQLLVAAGRSSKFFGILWSNLPFICSEIK